MRALFLKARMAWKKHKNDEEPLPDPIQCAAAFGEHRDSWNEFTINRLMESLRLTETHTHARCRDAIVEVKLPQSNSILLERSCSTFSPNSLSSAKSNTEAFLPTSLSVAPCCWPLSLSQNLDPQIE